MVIPRRHTHYSFRYKENIKFILLCVLCNGDCFAYELVKLIGEYSENTIPINERNIFHYLHQLEDDGYISSEKKKVGKRLERVCYHAEPAGIELFETTLAEHYQFYNPMNLLLSHSKYFKPELLSVESTGKNEVTP